jgi:hypothetical protein
MYTLTISKMTTIKPTHSSKNQETMGAAAEQGHGEEQKERPKSSGAGLRSVAYGCMCGLWVSAGLDERPRCLWGPKQA